MRLRLQVLLIANSGNIEENTQSINCLKSDFKVKSLRVVLLILKNISSMLRNSQAEAKKTCKSSNIKILRFQGLSDGGD